ncbi:hypothetical protein ATANTOWER_019358, partial [Ataeniobius toweri]|nr:hypothetical protein [Ataeniobius toweri]
IFCLKEEKALCEDYSNLSGKYFSRNNEKNTISAWFIREAHWRSSPDDCST